MVMLAAILLYIIILQATIAINLDILQEMLMKKDRAIIQSIFTVVVKTLRPQSRGSTKDWLYPLDLD